MVSQTLALRGLVLLAAAVATTVSAQQTCSTPDIPIVYRKPVLAPGYRARVIHNGVTVARGLVSDSEGNLLVVNQGQGVVALKLKDEGGACVSVASNKTLISDSEITHGIELSADGKTLYVSTIDKVFSWDYNATTMSVSATNKTLVEGMVGSDHISRTLLLSKKAPGKLIISRGSDENVDLATQDINSGHSQIRVYDVANSTGVQTYRSSGELLGWGLRNSVGVAEHPVTGGIWSVENSVDEIERLGVNIHENNPGEELNFHGALIGARHANTGKNFGYPTCFSAWNVSEIPQNDKLKVGSQFAMGNLTDTHNDAECDQTTVPARLTFPSHWAPLDIKFNSPGTTAWITAHGSWNRESPDGYVLYQVAFDPTSGEPVQPSTSTTHVIPIMQNAFLNDCPDACFRPVGLAWDKKGRLYMTSDMQGGEIYIITKTDGSGVDDIAAPANTTVAGESGGLATGATPSRALAAMERRDYHNMGMYAAAFGAGAYGFSL